MTDLTSLLVIPVLIVCYFIYSVTRETLNAVGFDYWWHQQSGKKLFVSFLAGTAVGFVCYVLSGHRFKVTRIASNAAYQTDNITGRAWLLVNDRRIQMDVERSADAKAAIERLRAAEKASRHAWESAPIVKDNGPPPEEELFGTAK